MLEELSLQKMFDIVFIRTQDLLQLLPWLFVYE